MEDHSLTTVTTAKRTVPLASECIGCVNSKHRESGYCYMFGDRPPRVPCFEFKTLYRPFGKK